MIDLGNGVKTNAQLTLPAIGKGPFPGVLLIPGSRAVDMNETEAKDAKLFWQIAQYLTERGFVVLRYDKRGIGTNDTIFDSDVWGNVTFNDLKQDAEKVLSVLLQQPEVNAAKKITLIAHSEGTEVAPRVAVDKPSEVKNIVLMGSIAHNLIKDLLYSQIVNTPLFYAEKVLDTSHQGLLSVKDASKDPIFKHLVGKAGGNLTGFLLSHTNATAYHSEISPSQSKQNVTNSNDFISIKDKLKPALVTIYENLTSPHASAFSAKCLDAFGCPKWFRSHLALDDTLNMIGNISSGISILILQGENDSQTPVQQAFLLQQRLTEVNHPDHKLITYPNLGHQFFPSLQWITGVGPIPQYVLADLYSWLEAHSGLSRSFATMPSSSTSNMTG